MPPSIVEKYEQILAADPRSRIFVELAKAFVERGDHARALDICRQGLEHHPSSILGRVIWGRALLGGDDAKGAMDQFEIAIALDPASPYAYNLVGEALLTKGLHREALPVLARAVELQPADARVKGWLEDAKRRAKEPHGNGAAAARPAQGTASVDAADETTATDRPLVAAPPVLARAAPAGHLDKTAEFELPPKTNGVAAAARTVGATPVPASPPNPVTPTDPLAPSVHPKPFDATPRPPPLRELSSQLRDEIPRSLLSMIPGGTRTGLPAAVPSHPAATHAPHANGTPDAAEADRLAAQFEQEVRERLLAAPEPAPSVLRRHRRGVAAVAALLAIVAAASTYLAVDAHRAAELATGAAARARVGLARDTLGSLREAARLLDEARRRAPDAAAVRSLSAQVAAVLATEHGDAAARALAQDLASDDATRDGALAARYLLAEKPAERAAAEAAILGAPPSSEPFVQALAGRILVGRGELEAGRGRLEIAARATPPMLRALTDLGDAALAAGDAEAALGFHATALTAHATHPRAAVGAAEARLALGRDLDVARKGLAAIEADAGSAPPLDLRARFEIATARVLAATGDADAAARRLAKAQAALGESPALVTALADVQLSVRAWDRAEVAAARAVQLSPKDTAARVLLARARIGRGRYAEALAATEGTDGRAIRLQRAIARYRLGQMAEARAELERTARDGRMPAEAAVWYALTEVALGRPARAEALVEKLAATRNPPPLAGVALGKALEADGKPDDAERAYAAAIARDPAAPEPRLALGTLRLARGHAADALPELEKAVAADPSDMAARRALGAARLAAGQPSAARAELDAVLLARPADPDALKLLSAAWLAEAQPIEARRAAERGLAAAPRDPALLLAGARAALATGDRAQARALAERAVKAGARGADAAEAKKIAAEAGGGARKRRR